MKLTIGIVGLPNVGKSTLFNTLTKNRVNVANYPFATIDPNVGVVAVPDERLQKVGDLIKVERRIPTVVEFYDIAGLVKGASKGEGLGNQFLSHIREVSAIVHVVRCFPESDIVHVEGGVDPLRDIETIMEELFLKDKEIVLKRFQKAESDARSGRSEDKKVKEALERTMFAMEDSYESFIKRFPDPETIDDLDLLITKPQLFLLNGKPEDVDEKLKGRIKEIGYDLMTSNLAESDDLGELINKAYEILDLITFFTFNEEEIRAWPVEKGTNVRKAVGLIHSDFEEKFIRAEVINWEELIRAGGRTGAKGKGTIRTEGKDYVVRDGDVVLVKHG